MSPAEFWESTPYEVRMVYRGHELRQRSAWELVAQLAVWIANNATAFGRKHALKVDQLIRRKDAEETPNFRTKADMKAYYRRKKREWVAEQLGLDPDEVTDEDMDIA